MLFHHKTYVLNPGFPSNLRLMIKEELNETLDLKINKKKKHETTNKKKLKTKQLKKQKPRAWL